MWHMNIRTRTRQALVVAAAVTTLTLAFGAASSPATNSPAPNSPAPSSPAPGNSPAERAPLDPSAMERGGNPAITYLVRNTIRDGALRVPATSGVDALWDAARGYVVQDFRRGEPERNVYRLTFVGRDGEKKVLARAASSAAVSENGRRAAWSRVEGRYGAQSVVTVVNPATGKIIETRRFPAGARVVAVTGKRVLVSRLFTTSDGTLVWNHGRGTLRQIAAQSAVSADIRNDRLVLDVPRDAPACVRVARFSRPGQTLWASCRWYPHAWSPNGDRALATHTYFDAAGTDRWLVVNGTTGTRQDRITGRLDWDVAWEDDGHFLTMAQGEDGKAAVIRCDVSGACERASRLWDIGLPEQSVFYDGPPVVLSE